MYSRALQDTAHTRYGPIRPPSALPLRVTTLVLLQCILPPSASPLSCRRTPEATTCFAHNARPRRARLDSSDTGVCSPARTKEVFRLQTCCPDQAPRAAARTDLLRQRLHRASAAGRCGPTTRREQRRRREHSSIRARTAPRRRHQLAAAAMAATPRPVPMHAEMERQQREEEKPAEAPDAQLARRPAGELADSAA